MAANIHTHNFRQCSHASVGLAQARPNLNVNHRTKMRLCFTNNLLPEI